MEQTVSAICATCTQINIYIKQTTYRILYSCPNMYWTFLTISQSLYSTSLEKCGKHNIK